jgi:hypothetical protein
MPDLGETLNDAGPQKSLLGAPLDARLKNALAGVVMFALLFALGGFAGWGGRAGLSILIGGAIAVFNLYALGKIMAGLVSARSEGDPSAGMYGVFAVGKVVLLFGGVWALMSADLVHPIGLVVGWGALPVGVAVASLFGGGNEPNTPPQRSSTLRDKSLTRGALHANEAPPENGA